MRYPCLFLAAVSFLLTGSANAAEGRLRVDPIKPGDVNSDGAFCVWFLPKSSPGKPTKVAEMDGSEMVVRINGKLERLMSRSTTWLPQRQRGPQVGDTCEEIWANSSFVIELSYKMTKSEYEFSAYSGQMRVSYSSTAWRAGMRAAPAVLDVDGETGS